MTESSDGQLFSPTRLGAIDVANRVAMAPLTRNRAVAGAVPSPLAVEYYAQRATAGKSINNNCARGDILQPIKECLTHPR